MSQFLNPKRLPCMVKVGFYISDWVNDLEMGRDYQLSKWSHIIPWVLKRIGLGCDQVIFYRIRIKEMQHRWLWRLRKGSLSHKECGQLLEVEKEMDFPLELPKGMHPCQHLGFLAQWRSLPDFWPQNCKIINMCCSAHVVCGDLFLHQ